MHLVGPNAICKMEQKLLMVGVTWATSPAHFSLISCVSALCFHLCGGYEGSLLKNTCMMYSSDMTEVEVSFH